MIPALLATLAIVDAGFCGFRDAAGRDRRIAKAPYYRRAIRRGMALGCGVVATFSLAVGALLFASADRTGLWSELVQIAGRMVVVYGAYATLVISALAVYLAGSGDVRAFGTVAVLGPFTLIRPLVIAGGAAWGMASAARPSALVLAGLAATAMILFQPALERFRAGASRSPPRR